MVQGVNSNFLPVKTFCLGGAEALSTNMHFACGIQKCCVLWARRHIVFIIPVEESELQPRADIIHVSHAYLSTVFMTP